MSLNHFFVEVRDSRTGYLVPGRDGPGALPNGESCWDAAAAVVAVIFPGTGSQNVFFRKCCTKKGAWKHIIFPGTGSQNVFFRKCCT